MEICELFCIELIAIAALPVSALYFITIGIIKLFM